MKSMSFAFLLSLALLWPSVLLAAHLEGPSSSTAHVRDLGGGAWQAAFKVELWSEKTRKSSIWGLIIDQQGCRMTPLDPLSQGALLTLPREAFIPWTR